MLDFVPRIPTLDTGRLILRVPEAGDFEPFAAYFAEERSWGTGGPLDRPQAWRAFASQLGHWHLRGYGLWTVVERSSGAIVGQVGFWNPEGWLEREIGWTMYPGFEGRGLAFEAAMAARAHAYDSLGWGALVSVIAPGNDRSIRLAERMGARLERDWTAPNGKAALIWRHPGPEARA